MAKLWLSKVLRCIAVSSVCIMIANCSSTRYVLKNSDSSKSNDAQLRMDVGECTMIANQNVPALPPQGQNINQNVTVNTYPYGSSGSYGATGMQGFNQSLQQMNQHNYERNQRNNAQRQLNNTKDEIINACMASKGWYKEQVENQQYSSQDINQSHSSRDCEVNCGNRGWAPGYCERMCAGNSKAY